MSFRFDCCQPSSIHQLQISLARLPSSTLLFSSALLRSYQQIWAGVTLCDTARRYLLWIKATSSKQIGALWHHTDPKQSSLGWKIPAQFSSVRTSVLLVMENNLWRANASLNWMITPISSCLPKRLRITWFSLLFSSLMRCVCRLAAYIGYKLSALCFLHLSNNLFYCIVTEMIRGCSLLNPDPHTLLPPFWCPHSHRHSKTVWVTMG